MRKSSVPMAEPTMADPANAVEAAALLVEAVDAGTAVEAMRIVFSATAGWRRKQLAKHTTSKRVGGVTQYVDEGRRVGGARACLHVETQRR